MLELLLYCHLFAKLRFAAEIAVVTDAALDLIAMVKARYGRWLGPPPPRRRLRVSSLGYWAEQDLGGALDRLNAYVASAA